MKTPNVPNGRSGVIARGPRTFPIGELHGARSNARQPTLVTTGADPPIVLMRPRRTRDCFFRLLLPPEPDKFTINTFACLYLKFVTDKNL
jgi:hypothetical protein